MYFQCSLSDLLPAINLVERAVAIQDSLPIITGIQLTTDKNKIILTSTNLELGVETDFLANVMNMNKVIVDGKLLAGIARKLPDQPIIFELIDNRLVITSGMVEFSLNIFNPLMKDDFPNLPKAKQQLLKIPAENLLQMIRNTIYACGKDDKRAFLNGVLFELHGNKLNFVATDINRLSFYSIPIDDHHEEPLQFLIPMKTLQEIQRCVPNDETEIKISYNKNNLIFQYSNNVITTRVIDDQFPKYANLFPKEEQTKIKVNKRVLESAVERSSLFYADDGSQIVIFNAENGILEIRTPESSKGKSQERINVEQEGGNSEAAFSSKYILDMLKATTAEGVIFNFNSDLRQCLLQPDSEEEHKYILMPIRLS